MMNGPQPPSPCDNSCVIDPETGVCAACGRTLDEIERWWTMGAAEKHDVLRRASERLRKGGE